MILGRGALQHRSGKKYTSCLTFPAGAAVMDTQIFSDAKVYTT